MADRNIVILDPVSIPTVRKLALTPRPGRIEGLRVAVVDNTKPNFNVFMDRIQELLTTRYKVAQVGRFVKPGRTVPVAHSVVDEILAHYDFAIAGLGD